MSEKHSGFYSLHLNPKLLGVLDSMNFTEPTPIQKKAIPKALNKSDVIGLAQTGTGKTLAFALPMLQKINSSGGRGLVLVPTRELAFQAAENIEKFLPVMELKAAVIIGGASGSVQYKQLKENPDIIIATPGRLIEHLCQKNTDLSDVHTFVLDEADRMLDMGFLPQVERIMKFLPEDRQTMLFSATMSDEIVPLVRRYMKNPARVEVSPQGTAPELVKQELYIVERGKKTELLGRLLDTYWGSVLLFVRTRYNAKKIAKLIRSFPHSVAELHSNRSMNQRKEALEGFKSGKYRILVATDIAARGIDVTGIELVINYDLPDETENYVHRIGRTGRAGHPGHSITFAAPDQEFEIRAIEKMIRKQLTVVRLPEFTADKFVKGTVARPKGEKRLPRREMAGSENDPVKKPRNIFAARRKEAAMRKARKAAEAAGFIQQDMPVPETGNSPAPEFAFDDNNVYSDSVPVTPEKVQTDSEFWQQSDIEKAAVKVKKGHKTVRKSIKERKSRADYWESQVEPGSIVWLDDVKKKSKKTKKSEEKNPVLEKENPAVKKKKNGRRTGKAYGTDIDVENSEALTVNTVYYKKKISSEKAVSGKRHTVKIIVPEKGGHGKNNRQNNLKKPALRFDKDYKPPRRSLIMDSAYFDDDTPEKRYFDRRRRRPVPPSRFSRSGSSGRHHHGSRFPHLRNSGKKGNKGAARTGSVRGRIRRRGGFRR